MLKNEVVEYWLKVQTADSDTWRDVMHISSDDPHYTIRDLLDHGKSMIQTYACVRAMVEERPRNPR